MKSEELSDIIVTAIEGGSNYWYVLSEEAVNKIRDIIPKNKNPYLSEALVEAIELGGQIPINDIENPEEVLGVISSKSIKEGLDIAQSKAHMANWINEIEEGDYDAATADGLFQLFVMGEVIYG